MAALPSPFQRSARRQTQAAEPAFCGSGWTAKAHRLSSLTPGVPSGTAQPVRAQACSASWAVASRGARADCAAWADCMAWERSGGVRSGGGE